MYYNLINKKQRKQFWKDCEKAIAKCAAFSDTEMAHYNWEQWKKMSAVEVLHFWNNTSIWEHRDFEVNLSKNAYETFEYYRAEVGIEELDSVDSEY